MSTVWGRMGGSVDYTSDFGSGHDLMVRGFEPHIGLCVGGAEPAWDSLSSTRSLLPHLCSLSHSLSLKISKLKIKDIKRSTVGTSKAKRERHTK